MALDERWLLADANLAEFAREHARWLPPTEIVEHTDMLLSAAGTRAPGPWNAVMTLGARPADPERVLAAAKTFFDPFEHHASIYIRAHLDLELELACRRHGFELGSDSPGMLLSAPAAPPSLTSGSSVRQVQNELEARDFVEIAAKSYETLQIPSAVTRKLFEHPARWCAPHIRAFVLYEQTLPAAGAMLLWSHGIAGIYWVGCAPQARRRGYAEQLTRALCEYAFAHGARLVVLQASREGEPIYRRIGFEEFTRYRTYRRPYATSKV